MVKWTLGQCSQIYIYICIYKFVEFGRRLHHHQTRLAYLAACQCYTPQAQQAWPARSSLSSIRYLDDQWSSHCHRLFFLSFLLSLSLPDSLFSLAVMPVDQFTCKGSRDVEMTFIHILLVTDWPQSVVVSSGSWNLILIGRSCLITEIFGHQIYIKRSWLIRHKRSIEWWSKKRNSTFLLFILYLGVCVCEYMISLW